MSLRDKALFWGGIFMFVLHAASGLQKVVENHQLRVAAHQEAVQTVDQTETTAK